MSTAQDPIILALTQNRLDHISHQMGWVMVRTARSPIFSQAHDFSCFIAGPQGEVISQADGIPIHTGSGGFGVRAILRDFDGEIAEGDVYLLNDPWAAGGNHLPDWVIARPVFVDGRLVGFTCNRAHQSDIGGGAAGTYNPTATEVFHEGIRLPVLRLVEAGKVRRDLWKMLLLNTRTPHLLDGDLNAMLGSTRIGMERVAALVEELGVEAALGYFTGVLDHADRLVRAEIGKLPDGVYIAEDRSDNDCFEIRDVTVRVALTIQGDRLIADFTGSDPQIKGFKNSTLANSYSAVYTALASFLDPNLPHNEGAFRCVEMIAPEGSIVNAGEGAATTMCTVFFAHEIIHAVWKALAQADPLRGCAGWAKNVFGLSVGKDETGAGYVFYHGAASAGSGAVRGRDGFNQIGHVCTLGGLTMPNVEIYEQLYPVRFQRQEFRTDAAGPGKWRGGSGCDYAVDILTPATHSFRGEGLNYETGYGIQGGGFGAFGTMRLEQEGRSEAAPKFGLKSTGPVRFVVESPGGGGYGQPLERDPALVLRDWRDAIISEATMRDVYGVVAGADGRSVDAAGTEALRYALGQEK
ncbi:MAG: hydantoinase B/oxoprolinase family protein [Alphaproteobacteria bacterium]|nr:hydantoinase B/oxoprolinase family protein [Alphaproteobacteria bacterium]MBU0798739.1 hydantoinase B/oxoprolinase family protein [Alphaproteobacteria bacterium]MBU0886002.1 hydantoinase B/oxoprolinase family protein [Alphaproteobacteria bacterium]MBU1811991.1 hydantoinase B/oxoprolinase family protein [Alphaproteobacteria bacterium]MBU2092216.1 hydantoinase B/oxoprolinase family protein [Alphaproteobacteria bacterium]